MSASPYRLCSRLSDVSVDFCARISAEASPPAHGAGAVVDSNRTRTVCRRQTFLWRREPPDGRYDASNSITAQREEASLGQREPAGRSSPRILEVILNDNS